MNSKRNTVKKTFFFTFSYYDSNQIYLFLLPDIYFILSYIPRLSNTSGGLGLLMLNYKIYICSKFENFAQKILIKNSVRNIIKRVQIIEVAIWIFFNCNEIEKPMDQVGLGLIRAKPGRAQASSARCPCWLWTIRALISWKHIWIMNKLFTLSIFFLSNIYMVICIINILDF